MMKPNSWPEKQHDHLQGELKGQRNLERLQSDVIKYINMFSHLPARTKLYELCLCRREDAGMWKIVKWNESCHQGAADWFWPPAKRALIGCWPLNATAPQFSGVELIMLIAKDWKTNICILKQKDILACLPLIRLSIGVAPVCVHASHFSHTLEEVIMKMADNDMQKSGIMSPKQHEMSLYKYWIQIYNMW